MKRTLTFTVLFVISIISFVGCSAKKTVETSQPVITPEVTATDINTPTPAPPTLTPEPLAAVVNGEGITLVEFQAELQRYQKAQQEAGNALLDEKQQRQIVLDEMVGNLLLAQGAYADGFSLSEADLKARLQELTANAGGDTAMAEWLQQNGYTSQSFEKALARSIAAAWKRDQLASGVPATVEQVHAQQILVFDRATADALLADIKAGVNFATYAVQLDPLTGGELGWFPRGFLLAPEVEEAAFLLQPGEVSPVIQSKVGYHILFVEERESQRLLSPDARQALQRLAIQKWVVESRKISSVQMMMP